MTYLLAIDLGSTNLKAVVFDPRGTVIASASRPTQRVNPDPAHPQWAIWRPEQIWEGVCQAVREVMAAVGSPAAVRAVCVTGMGMDGLPISKDGDWLYPMISWHCPRTAAQHAWWSENIGPLRQFGISGTQLWVFCTALRILWMRENEPEIFDRTHKWVLIEDFVNYLLSGVLATDYSMASTTLLWDQRKRVWSEEILRETGIDRQLLCDASPAGTVLGHVTRSAAEATGLVEGTLVVLGGHDYCCGELPVGAFRPGVLLDVLGTWEMVVGSLDSPPLTPEAFETGMFIDSHVARDQWTFLGATVAGDMLEWYRQVATELGGESRPETEWPRLLDEAAGAPAGSGGVLFLPHMTGSHCPVVDHRSMGAWVGLRNTTSRGHLLRAMIEGLNFQFRQILSSVETVLGGRQERLVAIGGGTKNAFWMRNKADVVGRPIEVPDMEEAVPLGAAILAGIGAGVYEDEADAFEQVYRPGAVFEPNLALTSFYEDRFALFERLYPCLRELNASLFDRMDS